MAKRIPGLYERWLSIERCTGRSMTEILDDLNTAAGTNYKHNWPSVVASRNFELERCPVEVRRYMMRKVLANELSELNIDLPKNKRKCITLKEKAVSNGTDKIANHFAEIASTGVCFIEPEDYVETWLPIGYSMVKDPEHIISGNDCVLPHLSNDWRLVSSINGGTRVGLKAKDVGDGIRYIATIK